MDSNRWKLILLSAVCIMASCSIAPRHTIQISDLVALGDSMTMGIQDAGLITSRQLNCYPYLVAQQMGQADGFQQPLVASPGIGVPPYERPLDILQGRIISFYLTEGISEIDLLSMVFSRLGNAFYPDPYNNLAVNGARLHDLRYSTGYDHTFHNDPNYFFDITLRNREFSVVPNFDGRTMIQEAALLEPKYILLWIGNNDALGYVLGGGEDLSKLLDPGAFKVEYQNVLNDLKADTPDAKIVIATIPEYLPFGYALNSVFVSGSAKLFDPKTLQPIDFGSGEYIDLYIESENEGDIEHLLLTGAAAYIELGAGIPASLSQDQKETLADHFGITVDKLPVPPAPGWITKDLVFTDTEEQATLNAIHAFNEKIWQLAAEADPDLPVVDANAFMKPGNPPYSWDDTAYQFALVSQDFTAFSLDGVHVNNYGHALIANAFIAKMNSEFGLSIPTLDPEDYRGQYHGKQLQSSSLQAIRGLREMYLPRK